MNWNKANRVLDDVIYISAIIILPLWILEIIGICEIVRKVGGRNE